MYKTRQEKYLPCINKVIQTPLFMPNSEKKIFCSFRLSVEVIGELEALAEASNMDKTEIIESAIMGVRPVIQRKMRARLEAVESLPRGGGKGVAKTPMETAVAGSSAAIRLAQESETKQKAESPSENKPSRAASGRGRRH
jgi:hypothetical protein